MGNISRPLVSKWSTPVILIGLCVLVALIAIVRDDAVFLRVVTVMFISVLLAVALQMFMGNSGLGSFGQYAFVAIGAYASLWFGLSEQQKRVTLPDMPESWWIHSQHYPFELAIVAAMIVTGIVGGLIGIAFVRLRGASFTIATFAFLIVINRVALQWEEVTRGSRVVIGVPKQTTLWIAVAWACLAILVAFVFKESPWALKRRASREDEDAAASIGINVKLMRWIAWTISCAMSAIGGALWAYFIVQFTPNNFYLHETFLIVAMLVIGGAASVSGAVVGAISVALSSEFLRQTENWLNTQRNDGTTIGNLIPFQLIGFTEIVLAVVMISVLILRPSGLLGGRELRFPRGTPQPGVTDLAENIDE
ncbi:MAG: branched-chain amino acid ABC transporter permease [Thermomicrobiales bacterium]|nr:branched-chain amino acid ABC transporter permease [Thermomicrobiales bacterium]